MVQIRKTVCRIRYNLLLVNVTVNVSREEVKVDKPVEAAPAPAGSSSRGGDKEKG